MITSHSRLAARAAAAWADAVTLEKEVALRKAAEIIARESASRHLAMPAAVQKAPDLFGTELTSLVEKAPAIYREAIRTLAGCLLAEEAASEASISLTFSILGTEVQRSRPSAKPPSAR